MLGIRGMSVVMRNSQKKVLPFPKPREEPGAHTIVCQIGDERFAIHYEIEDLPPVAPVVAITDFEEQHKKETPPGARPRRRRRGTAT